MLSDRLDSNIGATFKAHQNDFVTNLSPGLTVLDDVPIGFKEGLKFSFDLVDVVDDKDKNKIKALLTAAEQLPFGKEGLSASGAAPFITAASTVLELFGRTYLTASPTENKTIWSKDVSIELSASSEERLIPKLTPGTYFFGGFSKYAKGSPAWEEYQLRGTGIRSSGDFKYLYRLDEKKLKLVPADFSYVIMEISWQLVN